MGKTLFICFFINIVNGWDLNNFGINEKYYVSSIAIYRARAFLALPRSICHNNISNPTVVEVPWTSGYKQPVKNYIRFKILENQEWEDCSNVQDAVSLDIEPRKPKLWILDKGSEFCHPKILSYNLIFNSISDISELKDVPTENLNVITIDPRHRDFGSRMYIGNAGDNTLLVFSTSNLKWWKLDLREMSNSPTSVKADFLAISKTNPILYITARDSLELFSVNLDDVEASYEAKKETNVSLPVNINLIGHKMGISTGLETDFRSGLSYYMVRDYVVVRWLIGLPMDAEHHSILTQSYEQLPYVAELFTDSQSVLWALVNPLSPEDCQEMNNTITENVPKLESRVVKILKYNKLLDMF